LKRAIIISVILHLLIIVVVFFLKPEQREKRQQPLIAEIITPAPPATPPAQKPQQQRKQQKKMPLTRSPRIKDKEPPKVMSEVPAQKSQRRKPGTARKEDAVQKPAPPGTGERTESARKPIVIPPGYGVLRQKDNRTNRDKLFDSEMVARTAKQRSESDNDGPISLNTRDYRYFGYMQRLREKIEATWRYPGEAGVRRISGEVYIRFVIAKNGRLVSVEIVESSGYRALDDAAVAALREAAPYWPLPSEWKKDDLTITGRFIYSVRNQRVR